MFSCASIPLVFLYLLSISLLLSGTDSPSSIIALSSSFYLVITHSISPTRPDLPRALPPRLPLHPQGSRRLRRFDSSEHLRARDLSSWLHDSDCSFTSPHQSHHPSPSLSSTSHHSLIRSASRCLRPSLYLLLPSPMEILISS